MNIIVRLLLLIANYLHMQYNCNMNDFKLVCAKYGIRATTVRAQLYALLKQSSPLLAAEFIDMAKNQGFDTVTIYRTLNLFHKLGIVYEFGSGKQRTIQLHQPDHDDHHHFIRCVSCNKVARFEDPAIEQQLLAIAQKKGFALIDSHYLEIIGTCASCNQLSRTA